MKRAEFAAGTVIAHTYHVDSITGQTPLATSATATHLLTGKKVFVKCCFAVPAQAAAMARLISDVRAAGELNHAHLSHLVAVIKLGDTSACVLSELMDGRDLDRVIVQDAAVEPALAVDWTLQALAGISALHARGIVHGALGLRNLFAANSAAGGTSICVTDVGMSHLYIAAAADEIATASTADVVRSLGALRYFAPEQMQRNSVSDCRTDVWAVGAILFRLLSGRHVFDAGDIADLVAQILQEKPRIVLPELGRMGGILADVIGRCLQKDKTARYSSVLELTQALSVLAKRDSPESHRCAACNDLIDAAAKTSLDEPAAGGIAAVQAPPLIAAATAGDDSGDQTLVMPKGAPVDTLPGVESVPATPGAKVAPVAPPKVQGPQTSLSPPIKFAPVAPPIVQARQLEHVPSIAAVLRSRFGVWKGDETQAGNRSMIVGETIAGRPQRAAARWSILTVPVLAVLLGCAIFAVFEAVRRISLDAPHKAVVPPAAPAQSPIRVQGAGALIDSIMNRWAERFLIRHPGAPIECKTTNSAEGIDALIDGSADLAASVLPCTDEQNARAISKGFNLRWPESEHVVGLGAIAILVNPENPVSDVTFEQVVQLFSGQAKEWSQVGAGRGRVHVVLRADTIQGSQVFLRWALGPRVEFSSSAKAVDSDTDVISEVVSDPGAVGFVDFTRGGGAKMLKISRAPGSPAVAPSSGTVRNRTYPLITGVFLYSRANLHGRTKEFLDYSIGEGQALVSEFGLVGAHLELIDDPPMLAEVVRIFGRPNAARKRVSTVLRFDPRYGRLDIVSVADESEIVARQCNVSTQVVELVAFNQDHKVDTGLVAAQMVNVVARDLQSRCSQLIVAVPSGGDASLPDSGLAGVAAVDRLNVAVWVRDL